MQFNNTIGQIRVKNKLVELVQHNRLSHALLFIGKEGSGALPLALSFAQYVVCETVNGKSQHILSPSLFGSEPNTPDIYRDTARPAAPSQSFSGARPDSQAHHSHTDSCGSCGSCTKSTQLVHPDIHFSYPVVTKKAGTPPISTDYISEWREFIKTYPYGNVYDWLQFIGAENKQGNITAHECNDIIRKLNLKSFESEYKILLMWLPEYLGNEGNKLLKLIEEPPPNTLFILVAENESLILPTILSRCQVVRIPALETSDIENGLIERNKTEGAIARQVASVSEGNYREALQLVQHSDEDWQSLLRDWLNAIMKTGPIAQTKWVDEISKLGREKQKQFLRYFNHLLEQAIRIRFSFPVGQTGTVIQDSVQGGQTGTVRPGSEQDFALRLNKIASIEQQQAIIEELDRASYYIERNANGKMLFHALTIKVYHIIQDNFVFLTD